MELPRLTSPMMDSLISLKVPEDQLTAFPICLPPDGISEETVKIGWKIRLEFQQLIAAPEYLV